MNFLFAIIIGFAIVTVIDGQILAQSDDKAWDLFKKQFSKNYNVEADSGKRDRIRKQIFIKRCQEIKEHNSDPTVSYRQEVNRFTDMLPGQLKYFLGANQSATVSAQFKQTIKPSITRKGINIKTDVPYSLDYRYDPCLPDIKNQGKCPSSWAFSAMTPIEFAYCKKNNNISVLLSEQQLMDCDLDDDNKGCNGGWPVSAWNYMLNNGIASASQYPYKNAESNCKYNINFMKKTGVMSYNYVEPENVADMQIALVKFGALSAVMAVTDSLFSYANGVYNGKDCDGAKFNHAVVIVGWGNLNGMNYWIVRNSWGSNWGKDGYFLIERGVNKCKIETYPAYVLVE